MKERELTQTKPFQLIDLENLKILIVSTQKTGNTWLRLLLSHIYNLPIPENDLPITTEEFKQQFAALGNRWVTHQHYRNPSELVDFLRAEGVITLTTIRHPGDVLTSLFHYVKWIPQRLFRDNPDYVFLKNDNEFIGENIQPYLQNHCFAEQLQISLRWMPYVTGVVRYEDLLANPIDCLISLTNTIFPVAEEKIARAVAACDIKNLRGAGGVGIGVGDQRHFRKGLSGEWKNSIPSETLQILCTCSPYPELCNQLGYSFDETEISMLAFDYATISPFYKQQQFDNGVKITTPLLFSYFAMENALQRWPNPFEVSSGTSFYNWLNSPVTEETPGTFSQLLITHLAYSIYQHRHDLQRAFPYLFEKDRVAFCQWFIKNAVLECELDQVFITPILLSLGSYLNNYLEILSQQGKYIAQLFLDLGNDFSEEHCLRRLITGEEQQLEFDLSGYKTIKRLRFDPLNAPVIIRLHQIVVYDVECQPHDMTGYETNAYGPPTDDHTLVFDTEDSQIHIDLEGFSTPTKIVVSLEYVTLGSQVLNSILQLERDKFQTLEQQTQQLGQQVQLLQQQKNSLEYFLLQHQPSSKYMAQLYLDTGAGFSEQQTLVQEVAGHEEAQVFEFDLSSYENLKQLRFDPLNAMTALRIEQIVVVDGQGLTHQLNYQPVNAYAQLGEILVFDTEDSQILITWPNLEKPQKVVIRLQYMAVGTNTYRVILQREREILQQQGAQIRYLTQLVQQLRT